MTHREAVLLSRPRGGMDVVTINDNTSLLTLETGADMDTVTLNDAHATLNIKTEAGNDKINVVKIGQATTLESGPDDDTVNVGTETSSLSDQLGTLDQIQALLHVKMGTGTNDVSQSGRCW